jgi:hypothetical protein
MVWLAPLSAAVAFALRISRDYARADGQNAAVVIPGLTLCAVAVALSTIAWYWTVQLRRQ